MNYEDYENPNKYEDESEYFNLNIGDVRPDVWQFRYLDGPWINGVGLQGEKISSGNYNMSFRGKREAELV